MYKYIALSLIIILSAAPVFAQEDLTQQYRQEEELLLLGERVVITATKTKKKVHEVPAAVTVITAEEIRNMGARNLMDVLRIVPGLNIARQRAGIFDGIEARGIRTYFSEKVLLMQDGHVLNNIYDGGPIRIFDDLPVNNIKQVEIVRGPGSAVYGANAFVAVINVITKNASDINGAEIKAGGGSFDTQQHSLLFGHQKNKFGIAGYFDYFDTEGPDLYIEKDVLSPAPYSDAPAYTHDWEEKSDLNLKLSYGDLTFWGKYLDKNRGSSFATNYALNDESRLIHRNYYGEMVFDHSFKKDLNVLARLYGNHIDEDLYWEVYPEGTVLSTGTFPNGYIGSPRKKMNTFGGELKFDYEIFKNNLTTFGTLFEKAKLYDPISYGTFNPVNNQPLPGGVYQEVANHIKPSKRQIWAFYLQNDLNLLDEYGVDLLLGVRNDHYSEFGDTTSPRAGLTWRIMPELDLKFHYGQAFRAPVFAELYAINNPAFTGNPNLGPEKLWTAETGFVYRVTPGINFSLNYFHTKIKDMIQIVSKNYVNTGEMTTNGVETEIRADFGEGNYSFINYTYQHPKQAEAVVQDVPNHLANVGLNFKVNDYLNSDTIVHYTGDRVREKADSRDKLSWYTTVDQTFILSNFYKTLELRASVYNLFDVKYEDPAPRATIPNDFPRPGISYFLELAYKF